MSLKRAIGVIILLLALYFGSLGSPELRSLPFAQQMFIRFANPINKLLTSRLRSLEFPRDSRELAFYVSFFPQGVPDVPSDISTVVTELGSGVLSYEYWPSESSFDELKTVVFFHGGGQVYPLTTPYHLFAHDLSRKIGYRVALIDYRLAPFHKFPAAFNDARNAVLHYSTNGPVVVMGDSAGGNLAAAVANESPQLLSGQVLLCPIVSYNFSTESFTTLPDDLFLTRNLMYWFRDMYARTEKDWTDPSFAPGLAKTLDHIPKTMIITADHDVLRDEAEDYAHALQESGVEVEWDRVHGFHGYFSILGFPNDMLDKISSFVE